MATNHDSLKSFALSVVQRLDQAGYQALWAGGCVRDLLLGNEPGDYDVATDATPSEVRNLFGRRKTLAVGESFGVIIVLGDPPQTQQVEVATFRSDGTYLDGRRPETVRFSTAREDVQRRDFTINGMLYDPLRDEVYDWVGGREDLRRGIIRAIGDAETRIREDKLRMLRAVRFAARFGFEIEPATATAISRMAHEINAVSQERIAQELERLLLHPSRRRGVELMTRLGLFAPIFPELAETWDTESSRTLSILEQLINPTLAEALAVLLGSLPPGEFHARRQRDQTGSAAGVCRRLRLSNDTCSSVQWLIEHRRTWQIAVELPLWQLKELAGHRLFPSLLRIVEATVAAEGGEQADVVEQLHNFLAKTPANRLNPPPLVTGRDLIEAGLRPGPEFQRILTEIRHRQLDEQVNSRDEALTLMKELIRRPSESGSEMPADGP